LAFGSSFFTSAATGAGVAALAGRVAAFAGLAASAFGSTLAAPFFGGIYTNIIKATNTTMLSNEAANQSVNLTSILSDFNKSVYVSDIDFHFG
jgi:hypothetical protein